MNMTRLMTIATEVPQSGGLKTVLMGIGIILVCVAGMAFRFWMNRKRYDAGLNYRRKVLGAFGMKTQEDMDAEWEAQKEAEIRAMEIEEERLYRQSEDGQDSFTR